MVTSFSMPSSTSCSNNFHVPTPPLSLRNCCLFPLLAVFGWREEWFCFVSSGPLVGHFSGRIPRGRHLPIPPSRSLCPRLCGSSVPMRESDGCIRRKVKCQCVRLLPGVEPPNGSGTSFHRAAHYLVGGFP